MTDDQDIPVSKRERSPSFPYLDLTTAVDLLKKVHRDARMGEARISDVARSWQMAEKSGSLNRYVAALGQYGLVDTSGSGDLRRVKVSQDGRRILDDDRPGVRESLCSEAALKPKLIRGLFLGEDGMPAWGRDRPSDHIAESALKFDLNFGQEAARRFLSVYDATIEHIIDSDDAKEPLDTSEQEALESGQNNGSEAPNMTPQQPHHAEPSEVNKINFRSSGDGKITITATLDEEGLDLLKDKIEALKTLLN